MRPPDGHGKHGHGEVLEGGRMRRGEVRTLLLAALLDGPAHGYELMRRLEERSGGRWRPSPGSVYPPMQVFADRGLVAVHEDNGRKVFELTDAGRAWLEQHPVRDESVAYPDSAHAQLRAALEQLHLTARHVAASSSAETVGHAVSVIQNARQALYRLLADEQNTTNKGHTP